MKRREFIAGLGGVAAWPVVAQGQRLPIVGYLSIISGALPDQLAAAFRRGLSETGFTDGRNVTFKYASAEGQIARLPALAEKLVGDGVDVIAAMGGSRSALAAKGATKSIPIVFTMGDADPVQVGAVASLARPGGNLTGISLLGGLLGAKRLELLRELVPNAKTIGVLTNPENRNGIAEREELETVIKNVGQQVVVVASTSVDDVSHAISSFAQSRVDAILVTADPIFTGKRAQIAALAAQHRIPAIYQWNAFVAAGGLISYGAELADVYQQAGQYTGRVLKGEKPANLPVQQPTKFQLWINLKAAKALGITVPPTLIARADEVIE